MPDERPLPAIPFQEGTTPLPPFWVRLIPTLDDVEGGLYMLVLRQTWGEGKYEAPFTPTELAQQCTFGADVVGQALDRMIALRLLNDRGRDGETVVLQPEWDEERIDWVPLQQRLVAQDNIARVREHRGSRRR